MLIGLRAAYLLHPPPNLEQRTHANGASSAALSPPAEDHQPHDDAGCRPPRLAQAYLWQLLRASKGAFPARRRSSETRGEVHSWGG